MGVGFKDQIIESYREYLFIYLIPTKEVNDKMQIVYIGDRKISLNPIDIDKESQEQKLKVGEAIDLSKTVLSNGTVAINKFEIKLR